MSDKTKDTLMASVLIFFIILIGILVLGFIVLSIYCWIRYGSLPPEEVPAWVWWLMRR